MNCRYVSTHANGSKPWYADLPVFSSYENVSRSEWRSYLLHVYGHRKQFRYPIDMRCFTFFYLDYLPPTWKSAFVSRFKPDSSPHFYDGDVVTAYGRRSHVNIYRYAYHTAGLRSVAHFQNDERIEVFHYANDCVRPRQGVGYWMMFSPGSGIFFNLGTTLSFDDGYNAACRYFNGAAALCSTCCTPVHRHIIRSARVQRISSIQIRGSRPGGLKLRRFEVIAVNSDCDANKTDDMGACPLDGDLTRTDGSVCLCDPMKPHINCDHHAPSRLQTADDAM